MAVAVQCAPVPIEDSGHIEEDSTHIEEDSTHIEEDSTQEVNDGSDEPINPGKKKGSVTFEIGDIVVAPEHSRPEPTLMAPIKRKFAILYCITIMQPLTVHIPISFKPNHIHYGSVQPQDDVCHWSSHCSWRHIEGTDQLLQYSGRNEQCL